MRKPQAEPGEVCPFHNKDVSKVCHKCPLYVMVRGTDMNTGKEVDEWGCSIGWLPTLLIENSGQQRQTGAAVESFRNEMVKANEQLVKTVAVGTYLQGRLNDLPPPPHGPKLIGD